MPRIAVARLYALMDYPELIILSEQLVDLGRCNVRKRCILGKSRGCGEKCCTESNNTPKARSFHDILPEGWQVSAEAMCDDRAQCARDATKLHERASRAMHLQEMTNTISFGAAITREAYGSAECAQ